MPAASDFFIGAKAPKKLPQKFVKLPRLLNYLL